MIAIAPVSESVLDRGIFMPSAQKMTGMNHVTAIDARPGLSRLHDDACILNDFAGEGIDLSTSVIFVGFLVGGLVESVDEFVAYTRGMAHVPSHLCLLTGVRAVVISGSIDQWKLATIEGCRAHHHSPIRPAFNRVHEYFVQRGFGRMFEGWKTVPQNNGTFLLEKK